MRLLLATLALVIALQPASALAQGGSAGASTAPPEAELRALSPEDRRAYERGIELADRSDAVREQRERYPGLRPTSFAREGECCVSVWYEQGGEERAVAKVDLRTGAVVEQWTGHQVGWEMARGYEGDFGHIFNSPWVLVPFGLLFLAPFVDPRRPFRLLHLDLLVLLGFGVSHVLFNSGEIGWSVPLAYPVLGYLLVRLLVVGFGGGEARGPLVPHAPVALLAIGAVVLFGARVVLNLVDSNVVDVGYAGVIGADHIASGEELYDGNFAEDPPAGDTYGPVNYLVYVPFERLIGWSGEWDAVPAAHGAAIAFDVLAILALVLLARRLRPGPEGTALAAALAFAWTAYPYSLFPLMTNSNDALVGALAAFAIAAFASPAGRGALVGLGGAAKFAPLALAPLLFDPRGRGLREGAVFAGVVALVLVAAFVPFIPPDGLGELYDRTLGFQVGRESPFSIWGLEPSLDVAHTLVQLAAVNLAALLLFFPARKTAIQAAALGAAVLIALQLATVHWFYLYVAWFAPLALAALFARHTPLRAAEPRAS